MRVRRTVLRKLSTSHVLRLVIGLVVMGAVCAFSTSSAARAAGQSGTDLAGSWVHVDASGIQGDLAQVQFIDSQTGWVYSKSTGLLATADGGTSWRKVQGQNLELFLGVGTDDYWTVEGLNGLSHYVNGSLTPINHSFYPSDIITDMKFADREHGWITGTGKKGIGSWMFSTIDGGQSWQQCGETHVGIDRVGSDAIYAIDFTDERRLWAVGGYLSYDGTGNTIVSSSDGGASWHAQYGSDVREPMGSGRIEMPLLTAVDFVDSLHGWVVGWSGTILSTSDGGETWLQQHSGTDASLETVCFRDAATGWAIGADGTVLRTADGGATWVLDTSLMGSGVKSIDFVDRDHGWAVGDDGVLLVFRPPPTTFSDIATSPYQDAILALARDGVIGGYADGSFRPNNPVLRAQFAKMIDLALGFTVTEGGSPLPFTDVEHPTTNLYPDDYVAVAYANGLIKGYGGNLFKPYADMTRAQLLTMVLRAAEGFKPGAVSTPPVGWKGILPSGDATHGANIKKVEYSGLLAGIDLLRFDIWGKATRGEVARVLWNLRQ